MGLASTDAKGRRLGLALDQLRRQNGCVLDTPPSTAMAWPFTYDASSLARNAAIAAISSGCPGRLSGLTCPSLDAAPRALAASNSALVPSVSMSPGRMALTRTPLPDSSLAANCARELIAALLAL